MLNRSFWEATGERAIKTAAQTFVALLGVNGAGLLTVDWLQILTVVGSATVLSIMTSLSSLTVIGTDKSTPEPMQNDAAKIPGSEAVLKPVKVMVPVQLNMGVRGAYSASRFGE